MAKNRIRPHERRSNTCLTTGKKPGSVQDRAFFIFKNLNNRQSSDIGLLTLDKQIHVQKNNKPGNHLERKPALQVFAKN